MTKKPNRKQGKSRLSLDAFKEKNKVTGSLDAIIAGIVGGDPYRNSSDIKDTRPG